MKHTTVLVALVLAFAVVSPSFAASKKPKKEKKPTITKMHTAKHTKGGAMRASGTASDNKMMAKPAATNTHTTARHTTGGATRSTAK